jgi:hypothetical protein
MQKESEKILSIQCYDPGSLSQTLDALANSAMLPL